MGGINWRYNIDILLHPHNIAIHIGGSVLGLEECKLSSTHYYAQHALCIYQDDYPQQKPYKIDGNPHTISDRGLNRLVLRPYTCCSLLDLGTFGLVGEVFKGTSDLHNSAISPQSLQQRAQSANLRTSSAFDETREQHEECKKGNEPEYGRHGGLTDTAVYENMVRTPHLVEHAGLLTTPDRHVPPLRLRGGGSRLFHCPKKGCKKAYRARSRLTYHVRVIILCVFPRWYMLICNSMTM
jgi:hypothetical protein